MQYLSRIHKQKTNLEKLPQQLHRDLIVSFADFFSFANLAILIISLPLFFNRSLEEGKIGTMKFWDARFNTTVYLWVN